MRKRIMIIFIVIISILILTFIGFSAFIGMQVVEGSTQLVTPKDTSELSDSFWEKYGTDVETFCEKYVVEKIELTSTFDGHIIPADIIYAENADKNNKTVIMVHGLGGNRQTNYPTAEMFLEQGYNVLTYDQRSSNENTAEYTTFGYWEKYDLIDYIDYINRQAPDKTLGVWGASFGGATAGLAMGYEDTQEKVDFLILDCPVSDMEWMVSDTIKQMDIGIPVEYMTWCGSVMNQIKLGFSYQDANVASEMIDVHVPTLIINSKIDKVTPYFMGIDLYEALPEENRYIWTVEDSEHTDMWLDYNQEYRVKVSELIAMSVDNIDRSAVSVPQGRYYMQLPGGNGSALVACLTIDKNHQFEFCYDYSSSYLNIGLYSIEDGVLIAKTSDGMYEYRFEVQKDETLVFIEEGSSKVSYYDHKTMVGVTDRAVFEKQAN